MGQKTHPIGFRLGITQQWRSNWYSAKHGAAYLVEDQKVRRLIQKRYPGAGIATVLIERPTEERISLVVRTARPGIIIGKGGREIDQLQKELEQQTGRQVKISIKEVDTPDQEAILVAKEVAHRLEGRIPVNRAIKEIVGRVMAKGGKGIKVQCSGRLGGAEIARTVWQQDGRLPLQTLRADIDYGFTEARTKYGPIGIKVWLFRGELTPLTMPAKQHAPERKRGEDNGPAQS
ncbi:MAG TPA: 30S ribosomal protein S3 [Candidatus Fraserbacteria bacterium]|nr:30S ribosomal protein S3 [Candidatus Fraserbacteria bacterium]